MFALAISTGFIYPHVVALELTIRHHKKQKTTSSTLQQRLAADVGHDWRAYVAGKSDFISAILTTQGLNSADVAAIHQGNQALFNS